MGFQAHFIELQSKLREWQQTSCRGRYTSGVAHNLVGIQDAFTNLVQAKLKYQAAVTNLNTEKSTLTYQVSLYANILSTKEADTDTMQKSASKLHGEVKKLKAELATLKNQVNPAVAPKISRTMAELVQNGNVMGNTTIKSGRVHLTVGATDKEVTTEHTAKVIKRPQGRVHSKNKNER